MGNLVFQATLGGQVNLVGPNTASTFNLNVPAIAGTLVTTGDTGTVTNTMLAASAYTAPGTIGSGTPNTGAFTTLSASSTTTLSGGTANGVAYLNGSKVVTTGSALVFDGTNLGVGVTSITGGYKAQINGNLLLGTAANPLLVGTTSLNFLGDNTSSSGMRIDSSGNLNIGQTAAGLANSNSFSLGVDGNGFRVSHASGSSSGSVYCNFGYNGSGIGSITQAGTTGVLYNITSDRRLKTDIVDFTDSGAYIDAFKPRSFTWYDGTPDIGFVTDEYQQVIPSAITGEPDATEEQEYEVEAAVTNEAGEIVTPAVMDTRTVPKYQQGDFATSAKMAIIVAELKSVRKRLAELEAK